jgi:hypothetical protein
MPAALERAIERIIALRQDAAAIRARESLHLLLRGVRHSAWPEVAWKFSRLTGDGYPLEFVFSSRDEEIRYTCEVAGPEMAEGERLLRVKDLLAERGAIVDETRLDLLRGLQGMGELSFGAWVGGRHGARGDSYKIYAESAAVDSATAKRIAALGGTTDLLSSRGARLRIIGYEPSRSRMEFYFKMDGLEPGEVRLLLRRFGLQECEAELIDLLSAAWNRPVRDRLPSDSTGVSFTTDSGNVPIAFSLHFYARSVFGGDARIRRRLLELAEQRRWRLGAYATISEGLIQRDELSTFHGIASFSVAAGRQATLQIGLRPPEENC